MEINSTFQLCHLTTIFLSKKKSSKINIFLFFHLKIVFIILFNIFTGVKLLFKNWSECLWKYIWIFKLISCLWDFKVFFWKLNWFSIWLIYFVYIHTLNVSSIISSFYEMKLCLFVNCVSLNSKSYLKCIWDY